MRKAVPPPAEVAEPGHAPRLDESRGQRRREAEGARWESLGRVRLDLRAAVIVEQHTRDFHAFLN